MPRNQMVVAGKKNQFTEVTTILRADAQRAKLQNYIDEVVRCKTRILDQREAIKSIREAAINDLNIEPKMFNSLVSLFFNNNFEQKKEELEKLEAAINALMQTQEDGALGDDD